MTIAGREGEREGMRGLKADTESERKMAGQDQTLQTKYHTTNFENHVKYEDIFFPPITQEP